VPSGAPEASNRRAKTPELLPSWALSYVTTKLPVALIAAAELSWLPVAYVLTRNSGPAGTWAESTAGQQASRRRARRRMPRHGLIAPSLAMK
jgi:hypothetical protein